MRISRAVRCASGVAMVAVIAGCNRDRLTEPASESPTPVRSTSPGVVVGAEGRAIVEREALRRARLGDRSMLDSLSAVPVEERQASVAADADPDDPSRPATIYWSRLYVSIGDVQFIRGEMEHDGDFGHISLSYQVSDRNGAIVAQGGPYTYSEWNMFAPLTRATIGSTVPLSVGYVCGRGLHGHGDFSAHFGLPFEFKLDGTSLRLGKFGERTESKDAWDSAPPCPPDDPPPDDGTTTGDGTITGDGTGAAAGTTYWVEMCWYRDWYWPDGTYLYTETVSCWAVYVDAS